MPAIDNDILRAVLQSQLENIPPEQHDVVSTRVVEMVRKTLAKAGIENNFSKHMPDEKSSRHLRELKEDGITLLGPVFKPDQVKKIHDYLDDKKVYGSHVWTFSDRIGKSIAEVKKNHRQCCYILKDILNAPEVNKVISDLFILDIVTNYLGVVPTVFQANMMWSFANDSAPAVAQSFHRDWDNFRFCVLFIYLTDVNDRTGSHQYIKGTHTFNGLNNKVQNYLSRTGKFPWLRPDAFYYQKSGFGGEYIEDIFKDDIIQVDQPAGYAFLADGMGLHRGLPLLEGERLMMWVRFGLYDNGYSVDVTPAPIRRNEIKNPPQKNKLNDYIFRSMIESEFTSAPQLSLHNVSLKKEKISLLDKLFSKS